jgi:hypothetical protein
MQAGHIVLQFLVKQLNVGQARLHIQSLAFSRLCGLRALVGTVGTLRIPGGSCRGRQPVAFRLPAESG